MSDRAHILQEIRRTAAANSGVALGMQRFASETGIRKSDWYGKYWARWGDALTEAGLVPNTLQEAYSEEFLISKLIDFIRELGRYPVEGELRLRARNDPQFPASTTLHRLGSKQERAAKLLAYAQAKGYDDIVAVCTPVVQSATQDQPNVEDRSHGAEFGFVYLLKFGRHFKIGRSNAVGRRERELAIQLPEKTQLVHAINTDDPVGIESYWHKRFESKRGNGEWFELASEDVAAFKRRRFM